MNERPKPSAEVQQPRRAKLLAVILGADAWPDMPTLRKSNAFALSASAFKDYLTDEAGLNLHPSCIKNLFNSPLHRDQIDLEIRRFLEQHCVEGVPTFSDLIVYYTGHGDFTRGDKYFQLLLPSTNESNSDFSGYQMRQLAATVNAKARKARKLVILDCCYAAAAFSAWQTQGLGDAKEAIVREAEKDFPDDPGISGTALICACNEDNWALYKDNNLTMFTGGLMQSLLRGDSELGDPLNIGDIFNLTADTIANQYGTEAVAPVLHVAKGKREAMVACALFPNPARRGQSLARRLDAVEMELKRFGERITGQQTALEKINFSLVGLDTLRSAFEAHAQEVSSIKALSAETLERLDVNAIETEHQDISLLGVPENVWRSCPSYVRGMYMRWRTSRSNGRVLEMLSACALTAALVPWGLAFSDLAISKERALANVIFISATCVLAYAFVIAVAILTEIVGSRRGPAKSASSSVGPEEEWEQHPLLIQAQSERPVFLFRFWPVSRTSLVISSALTLFAAIVSANALVSTRFNLP